MERKFDHMAGTTAIMHSKHGNNTTAREKTHPKWLSISINVFLIILALAVFLVLARLFVPDVYQNDWFAEKRDIVYTLEFYDVNGDFSTMSASGATVLHVASDTILGYVTNVESRHHTLSAAVWQDEWETLPSDIAAEVISLPVQIVTVTVSVRAVYREGDGYYIDGIRLAMGEAYIVKVANCMGSSTCVTIQPKEA